MLSSPWIVHLEVVRVRRGERLDTFKAFFVLGVKGVGVGEVWGGERWMVTGSRGSDAAKDRKGWRCVVVDVKAQRTPARSRRRSMPR